MAKIVLDLDEIMQIDDCRHSYLQIVVPIMVVCCLAGVDVDLVTTAVLALMQLTVAHYMSPMFVWL